MKPDIYMDSFERTEYSDAIFGMLGRALVYSCRFERLCKTVSALRQIKLSKGSFESKTAFNKFSQEVFKKSLFKAIESFSPTKTRYEIFERARRARNEIIHEAGLSLDCCLNDLPTEVLPQKIEQIKPLIGAIAEADFLLSFLTSMETHEPMPIINPDTYVNTVMNWVFETKTSDFNKAQ